MVSNYLKTKKLLHHRPLGGVYVAHRVAQSGRRLIVSTSFKIIMSVYFHAAPAATDFRRLKRYGFTRDIISRVSTVLFTSSLPTSRFPVFRLPDLSFPTTRTVCLRLLTGGGVNLVFYPLQADRPLKNTRIELR